MNSKGQIAAHELKNKLYNSQWEFARFGAPYWIDIDQELEVLEILKKNVMIKLVGDHTLSLTAPGSSSLHSCFIGLTDYEKEIIERWLKNGN